jgi:hypothetical protein
MRNRKQPKKRGTKLREAKSLKPGRRAERMI